MKETFRRLLAIWYVFHYWGGLFFFIFGIGLLQLASVLGLVLPVGPRVQRAAQALIRFYLRGYLFYLNSTKVLRGSFAGWRKEFSERAGIIVANHPSMLDAPFFLSRLPRGICIFKAALGRSILRGRAASLAGYMHSEDGVDGLRAAVEAVKGGSQFLFFPEGTRTASRGEIVLRPLYAVVAKYAQAPVHVFAIEHNSNCLCKGQNWWRVPRLPARYSMRFVQTIAPESAPTAAKLHERVEAVLRPIIEAHREPGQPGCYAERKVIEQSSDRVEWKLLMPPGPGFFSGHFPGHPIAPGAASIHWIEEAWAAGPGQGQGPARLQRVRFLREILPGEEVTVIVESRNTGWRAELKTAEGMATTATLLTADES